MLSRDAEWYIEATHQLIHQMEPDFDETVTFALTERDLLFLALALVGIQFLYPCLVEESTEIQRRVLEVVRVQKPNWAIPERDGEEGS